MDFIKRNFVLFLIFLLTIFLRFNYDTLINGFNYDEFAIISNALPSLVNATTEYAKEKLRSNKGKYIDAITISVGIANNIENTDCSIENLLRIADKKMYLRQKDFYSKNNLVGTV